MGSQQSKPVGYTDEKIKLITERLKALPTSSPDYVEDDYVQVSQVNEKGSRRAPSSMSVSAVERWQEALLREPKNRLALTALSSADPKTVLTTRSTLIKDPHVFNVAIPFDGAAQITNQRSSGRCWIFAVS